VLGGLIGIAGTMAARVYLWSVCKIALQNIDEIRLYRALPESDPGAPAEE